MEEIRNQKVVSSNPGAIYWMDIFYIDLLQNCDVWLKSTKINIKKVSSLNTLALTQVLTIYLFWRNKDEFLNVFSP